MLTSILVPLDGSDFAEQALPLATAIAGRARAKLRLALVHQLPAAPTSPDAVHLYASIELAVRQSEHEYLERAREQVKRQGEPEVVTALLTGSPGETLATYVDEIGASMLVMSTHGRGGLQRAWLGSVADLLVRSVTTPVVLIRPRDGTARESAGAALEGGRILVALDGSERAEAVLDSAGELARLFGAELTLVQVVTPVALAADPALPISTDFGEGLMEANRRAAQDYVKDVAERLRSDGVRATGTAVVQPRVADAILDLARAPDVGMIALTTHGRGGLRRLVLGSVADKLVRAAERPVLISRPPS